MVLKDVYFVKRRTDRSLSQFKDYWINEPVKTVENVAANEPGLIKSVVTIVLPQNNQAEMPIDGYLQVYFNPKTHFPEQGPELYQKAVGDMVKSGTDFIDFSKGMINPVTGDVFSRIYLEEHVLFDKGFANLKTKSVNFAKRRDGMSFKAFKYYWLNEHSKVVKNVAANNPGLLKSVVSIVVPRENQEELPIDGMVEAYIDPKRHFPFTGEKGSEDFQRAMEMLRADEPRFIDFSKCPTNPITDKPIKFYAEEYTIFERKSS